MFFATWESDIVEINAMIVGMITGLAVGINVMLC
jgi:hypothetical protein